MRVLLVNPPDDLHAMFGVGKEFIQKAEPLGLLYIAAVLRERGHLPRILDAHAEGLGIEAVRLRIEAEAPDLLGLTTLTCQGAAVFELGRWARQALPGTRIVLGNIHASIFARAYLENGCCDAVVHGEGEYVLSDLADRMAEGRSWDDINGISRLDASGQYVRQGTEAIVDDISALPFPARDLVDPALYGLGSISNRSFVAKDSRKAKTISSARGCPHRCSFCVIHGGRRPRFNSVERVVDEIQHLQDQYGTNYVFFEDPLFLANRKRVQHLCSEIIRRKISIRFGGEAHARHLDADLVRTLEAAGCHELAIGIESGSQRILDSVHKNITLEQVRTAVHTIKDNSDIQVEGLFILGLPGETKAEAMQSIRFACELPLDMAQFAVFTPYPGSPLFEDLARRGEIDTGLRPGGGVDPSVWRRYAQYILFTDIQPIWITPGSTVQSLRSLQKQALRSFYLRPAQFLRNLKRLRPDNFLKAVRIALRGFF